MSEKRVEVKIDYLNFTWHGERATLLGESDGVWSRGLYAYDSQLKTSIATYQFGDARQGNMVTLAGTALDDLRRGMSVNEHEFLGLFDGLKCTRVDLALDAFDYGLTAKALEKMWLDGLIKPRATQGTIIADSKEIRGDTFYLGSLKNRAGKLFRGYEKGKQQSSFLDHFRMELQLGSEGGANECILALRKEPTQFDVEYNIRSTISGYLKPQEGAGVIGDILSDDFISYKVANKHASNRRKWLETQVLPVLKKEMDGDIDFANAVAKFLNAPPN